MTSSPLLTLLLGNVCSANLYSCTAAQQNEHACLLYDANVFVHLIKIWQHCNKCGICIIIINNNDNNNFIYIALFTRGMQLKVLYTWSIVAVMLHSEIVRAPNCQNSNFTHSHTHNVDLTYVKGESPIKPNRPNEPQTYLKLTITS